MYDMHIYNFLYKKYAYIFLQHKNTGNLFIKNTVTTKLNSDDLEVSLSCS